MRDKDHNHIHLEKSLNGLSMNFCESIKPFTYESNCSGFFFLYNKRSVQEDLDNVLQKYGSRKASSNS